MRDEGRGSGQEQEGKLYVEYAVGLLDFCVKLYEEDMMTSSDIKQA